MFLDDLANIKKQMIKDGQKESAKRDERDKFKRLQDEFREYLNAQLPQNRNTAKS